MEISQPLASLLVGIAALGAAPLGAYLLLPTFRAAPVAGEAEAPSPRSSPPRRTGLAAAALVALLAIAGALLPTALRPAFDPYADLGLPAGASHREIMSVYRKLSLQHHPDRGGDAVVFQRIVRAYEALTDPKARENYDKFGNPEGSREHSQWGDMTKASEGEKKVVLVVYLVGILAAAGAAMWWSLSRRASASADVVAAVAPVSATDAAAARAAFAAINAVPTEAEIDVGAPFFSAFPPLFERAARALEAPPAGGLGAATASADDVRRIYAAWGAAAVKKCDLAARFEAELAKGLGADAVAELKANKSQWRSLLIKHAVDAGRGDGRKHNKAALEALIIFAKELDPRLAAAAKAE